MHKERELSTRLKAYVVLAMQEIERSRQQGHLIYITDYYRKFTNEAELIADFKKLTGRSATFDDIDRGFTTSPCFEQIMRIKKWNIMREPAYVFNLKPGMKASLALEDLLTKSTTTIDCHLATLIATYMVIRKYLIDICGEAVGNERFDLLFSGGNRRMALHTYDAMNNIGNPLSRCLTPIQLLSFFFTKRAETAIRENSAARDKALNASDIVFFSNHPQYVENNIFGIDGGFFTLNVAPDQFMCFGLGEHPLNEGQICQHLDTAYQAKPLHVQLPWLANAAMLATLDFKLGKMKTKEYSCPDRFGYISESTRSLNCLKIEQLTSESGFTSILRELDDCCLVYELKQRSVLIVNFRGQLEFDEIAVLKEIIACCNLRLQTVANPDVRKEINFELNMAKKNLAFCLVAKQKLSEAATIYHEAYLGFNELNEESLMLFCLYESYMCDGSSKAWNKQSAQALASFEQAYVVAIQLNNAECILRSNKFIEYARKELSAKPLSAVPAAAPMQKAVSGTPAITPVQKSVHARPASPRRAQLWDATQRVFKYNESTSQFWLTINSEAEANSIVKLLKKTDMGKTAHSGKIAGKDKQLITVAASSFKR